MHTVDASSDPIGSLAELPASNVRVCPDAAVEGGAQLDAPEFTKRTMAFDPILHPRQNTPRDHVASGIALEPSPRIPPWKRILDITFVLLSTPLWLPVMMFLVVWIKFA